MARNPAVTGCASEGPTNARRKGGRAMPYHRRWRRGCKASSSLPGWLSSLESLASRAPDPAACVAAPLRSRSGREHKRTGRPCRRGPTFGVEYLVRQARITDIDRSRPRIGRASIARSGRGSARRRGPDAPARLPAEREHARRRSATRARGRRAPRPPAVGRRRRLRRHGRPPGRLARPRRGPRDRRAPRGDPPLREQQGLLVGRGRRSPPIPRTSPASSGPGSPPPGQRSGAPSRRPVRPAAEPSAPGGREGRTAPSP